MKVLIADDELTSRILLESTLTDWGFEVALASDGMEAFEVMQQPNAPRLLILDWMMPRMDGPELCRRLRASDQWQYVYIILLTSRHEKQDVILGMDSGADAFLTKPVDLPELKSRLAAGRRILEHQSRFRIATIDKPTEVRHFTDSVAVPESGVQLPPALADKITDMSKDSILALAPRKLTSGKIVPTLGSNLLLRKIGEGGMGAVYHGYNSRSYSEVAVKVLSAAVFRESADTAARFYREAKIASMVHSDHLVSVTDVDEENGTIYLVMELVNGISAVDLLMDLARGENYMREADALDICIGAAEGLAAAHACGIVHRDVKPDNILIPADADKKYQYTRSKLADLGIARQESVHEGLTGTNVALGTAGFMSPEQIYDAKNAGKTSDVFGLGATLYSLLTARAPFTGDSPFAIFANTIHAPHTPAQIWRKGISRATIMLIDKCLAKIPEQRDPDGAALLESLKACRQALKTTSPAGEDKGEAKLPADAESKPKFNSFSIPVAQPKSSFFSGAHG